MTELHTVAIIQARFSASRLPGKVLREIAGEPMLVHVVERTLSSKMVDDVVIATTTESSDDVVVELCKTRSYPTYRGSQHDVLDRYYQAARQHNTDVIVRITADCPVIDPAVIDKTVNAFLGRSETDFSKPGKTTDFPHDFAANRLPPPWGRTYPIGLDTEVCSFDGLKLAWNEARLPHQREHVMPFFYEQPERFRILHVTHEPDYGNLRWTVDTPEDLDLVRQIFDNFPGCTDFSWLEILDLFEQKPELALINAKVQHKHYQEVDQRRQSTVQSS